MRKTIRRAAAAVAAALALGTGSAVWAASSASAAPTAPAVKAGLIPVCTAGDLAVWVNYGAMSGAAGTFYYPLEFTNHSNHTCRTWGWPGVSATNATGHQLGDAAQRLPYYTPHVGEHQGRRDRARAARVRRRRGADLRLQADQREPDQGLRAEPAHAPTSGSSPSPLHGRRRPRRICGSPTSSRDEHLAVRP